MHHFQSHHFKLVKAEVNGDTCQENDRFSLSAFSAYDVDNTSGRKSKTRTLISSFGDYRSTIKLTPYFLHEITFNTIKRR